MHIVAADAADLICQQRFTQLLAAKNIQFQSGKTAILPSSFPLLEKLSNTASLCSKSSITIAGHTDNGNEKMISTYVKNQGQEYIKLHENYQLALF